MSGSHKSKLPHFKDSSNPSRRSSDAVDDGGGSSRFGGQEHRLTRAASIEPEEELKVAPKRSRNPKPDHIKHRRTRTGCYTCRARRVKCDEQRPTCERCAKGSRECTYPEVRSNPRASVSHDKGAQQDSPEDSRSPSTDDEDEEPERSEVSKKSSGSGARRFQAAGGGSLTSPTSSRFPLSIDSSQSQKRGKKPVLDLYSPSTEISSAPYSASLDLHSKYSSESTIASQESMSWSHLPDDLQYYLEYHQNNLTSDHYFLKHDAMHFLHTLLIERALQYEPLLYAVAGFAAYHKTVRMPGGQIQDFLGYYDKAVSSLRKSLASRRTHSTATLLTILQLATFEEFLGDYVSLLSHQQAAFRMLSELYTPETIMESELGRKVFAWYSRFDLTSGLMSENETALSRDWFVAAEEYYQQQKEAYSGNIDYKIEDAVATHRLFCADLALFFSRFGTMTKTQIRLESEHFKEVLETWYDRLDPIFKDSLYQVQSFEGKKKDPEDIVDPYQPGGLRQGPLFNFNFMQLDWLAMTMMFKYKVALILQEPMPVELPGLALEACRLFETIEYWPDSPVESIIRAQACLGIASLFLPKDERYVMWCRSKLARIESLGHIYPATFRQRMAGLWGIPEINHWWLPNEEGYPNVVRSIRSSMENRLPSAANQARVEDQRNIKSIFANLTVNDPGDD